ncbi:glycerol kinase GlpK [Alteromonas oceanisediminis]|uniref:glycerol kinase GlpK n=1 Tax=Alteromonas oceanisediminis TaxID=2836180 RepID=UPI001BDB2AA9|nr:glycerol kinase GlpK [Alteromonas oceanisediminis]MBT0587649.1 glycerol kinase GlpK [Alteromonas oceanisediminis]
MTQTALLAIDQGTTSSRAIIFTQDARIVCSFQQEFAQHYPNDGWVEHDPEEIWSATLAVCQQALNQAKNEGVTVAGIGITNQRETTLIWDRATGKPIYNAIVWQDRRTATECERLSAAAVTQNIDVSQLSGLRLDPYFSATKIAWILDNVEGARARAERGELAFGTIDSFLIWRLTGGEVHATDSTNASRTNLMNLTSLNWDAQLLAFFDVPPQILPEIRQSADDFGTAKYDVLGFDLPIRGVAGDQQAAMIGQCCFTSGSLKSTYGTGCFALANTGDKPLFSQNQLLTTVAYSIHGVTHYAIEGSIFIAGAAVQWLRDGIKVINHAKQTQALAKTVEDSHGVVLVPAFAGLGAPYWDPRARGSVFGLTRATTEAHLARAALESVCYQTKDLLSAMEHDGIGIESVRVDGGMVANDWVCDYLADILSVPVVRPHVMETTALGAAYLAGLALGLYETTEQLCEQNPIDKTFTSTMTPERREALLTRWRKAVEATQLFAQHSA